MSRLSQAEEGSYPTRRSSVEMRPFIPVPETKAVPSPAKKPVVIPALVSEFSCLIKVDAIVIPTWIALSTCVIIFNKYIFSTLGFAYPVFLTTVHLSFAAVVTRILKATTTLIDGADAIQLTRAEWARSILPIGALFSGSLILSNYAYLTLSVSFIQMLKAFMPVAVLFISFAFRIQSPDRRLAAIVLLISTGTAIAAYGEVQFALSGFLCQCGGIAFEATRLVMIQMLLQGMKMDPLVSLHFYAPVCAAINLFILPIMEGLEPFYQIKKVGLVVLLLNASIAFLLNVSAVFLIAWSGLILTLSGIVKDILIIGGSTMIFATPITPLQFFGYSISLGGLIVFKTTGSK